MSLTTNKIKLQELINSIDALPVPQYQAKTVTPAVSEQTVSPDDGYDGLSSVTVNSIPDNYITTDDATATSGDILSGKTAYVDGSKVTGTIATKTASNLTASGATVTVPAGYYASQATKSVATATQATPSISVSSAGLITASATQSAGYVSAGTKSATKQLTVQAAKTVTPTKSSQTAVASGRYTTGAVTVAAIPDKYEDRTESLPQLNAVNGGTAATTIADAVDNTEALVSDEDALITQIQTALEGTTYDPSGLQKKVIQPMADDQIITADASYQALSQVTVKGDANLKGENIVSGVSIFGVPGTYDASSSSALQEKSITPTANTQIITADNPYAGLSRVTVSGDDNLTAGNIKRGVSIFGVSGDYGGSGGGSFIGEFASITDNGMFEPGANEYVFDYSNCSVNLSNVRCLLLGGNADGDYGTCVYYNDNYNVYLVFGSDGISSRGFSIDQSTKTITVISSSSHIVNHKKFEAYFA